MPEQTAIFDLSAPEAAAILGVHPDTLTRWTDLGAVRCWITPGGHRRYRRSDILALLPPEPAAS